MTAASHNRRHASQHVHTLNRVIDLVLIVALLAVLALAHGGVFSGTVGYRAVYGGLAVGGVSALICARLRCHAITTVVAGIGALLAGGGISALPETTLWGFVPTLDTIRYTLRGVVTSWKDLLTVVTPVPDLPIPVVLPYVVGVLSAFIAVTLVARTCFQMWALLPAAFLLLTGILWGSQNAPFALIVATLGGVLFLLCAVRFHHSGNSAEAEATIHLACTHAPRFAQLVSAVTLIAVGAAASAVALPMVDFESRERTVLRSYVEPPLDLREYASPVAMFRLWNTREADTELFHLSKAPRSGKIRLATLDSYDGTVFQIGADNSSGTFLKVGSVFSDNPFPDADTTELDVTIDGYVGNWVPGAGQTLSLQYQSERASLLKSSTYYSDGLQSILSTTPLKKGDTYRLQVVEQPTWNEFQLQDRPIAQVPIPADTNVPDSTMKAALSLTAGATLGFEQARLLQLKLSAEGFYSDGSDGQAPGHRTDRLEAFLSGDYMVGDDDQFAPAMVLMLRSLGIPSRLVMGFVAEPSVDGSVTIRGRDVRMWVEVPFEGLGWVPFEPTPPKDQTMRTEVPKPKPQPRPQVLQPPDPPEEPAEIAPEELLEPDKDKEREQDYLSWLYFAARVGGGILALLSPLLLLIAFKAMRSRRRRLSTLPEVRSVAAWDELLDRANDLGVKVPKDVPRIVQAQHIDAQVWRTQDEPVSDFRGVDSSRSEVTALADSLDNVVFGPDEAHTTAADMIWDRCDRIVASMRQALGWRRRVRAVLAVGSLRSQWLTKKPQSKSPSALSETQICDTVSTDDSTNELRKEAAVE
ncbi:transglutaminase-like domain-containing protein [Schaalia suimastitidis]|uniref:transglutaminase-like domain-containing protein n=1 Tax=Schaalia suimastitidis TaxID=121163 RepID=UPI0004267C5F|nr:transglutaminase-like domain-containing protein [Schaalia suimastitidis]